MKYLCFIYIILLPFKLLAEDSWDLVRQKDLEPGKTYKVSSGTGFFIDYNYIITNAHVVNKCINIAVRGAVSPTNGSLIATDQQNDLALIYVKEQPEQLPYLRVNSDVKSGDLVFIIGYPLEHSHTGDYVLKQAQIVDFVEPFDQSKKIEFTAELANGNSGGPLIDSGGNVIGVIQAKKTSYLHFEDENGFIYKDNENVKISGVAIGLSQLKSFLNGNHVSYRENTTYDIFTIYKPQDIAQNYIVNIHCIHE